jgi:hypothetical protein
MNEPIQQALEQARKVFGARGDHVLDLSADAVFARAQAGELRPNLAHLLELLVTNSLGPVPSWAVADLVGRAGWDTWSDAERTSIENVLDAWWSTTLAFHPFEPGVDVILASLAHFDLPLIRWLLPLLEQLDGPGALHLAEIVLEALPSKGWDDRPAARLEILGWCRTEAVVTGLTVVGGVHLAPGTLGPLLDELL